MKIDGESRREHATTNAAALAQTAGAQALVESFRATLQRFRRPDRDDTKSRPGAPERNRAAVRVSDRSAAGRAAAADEASDRASADRATADRASDRASADRAADRAAEGAKLFAPGSEDTRAALTGVAIAGPPHLRFLSRPVEPEPPKPASVAEFHAASLPGRAGGGAPASCIEVVHERTGTRFVLSRDGATWVLAIKSETTPQPAELASVIATLNEQFAARGLGAVDVILG